MKWRIPVAAIATVLFDEEGHPATVPLVVCDDGAVFQLLPEPDTVGRAWRPFPGVPGTEADQGMKGYDK